jgi:integrase
LQRFRIVKVSQDLQQTLALPEIICADPDGLPFSEGQAFYTWLIERYGCQPVTATTYLKAVLQFLTFLWFRAPPQGYNTAVSPLRESIETYLRQKLGCVMRPHAEGNLLITRSKTVTQQTIRLHLAALKRFYDYLIWAGRYPEPNPLAWEKWLALRHQVPSPQGSAQSGLTLTAKPAGRVPATYFCVVAEQWRPQIIDNPDLPRQLVSQLAHRRDQIIARMLFESGARVNEILSLTLADWHSLCGRRHGALATNKGSGGYRVKEVWWSSETSQQLRLYLGGERRQHDPFHRRLEDLSETVPLFITETGRSYRYPAFYFHWRQACTRLNLVLHPHQARHGFVTMALRRIETLADEAQRTAYRQGLIAYMHWKSPETIQAYDHHLHLADFGAIHAAIEQLVQAGQPHPVEPRLEAVTRADVSRQTWERLCQYFDPEEVS